MQKTEVTGASHLALLLYNKVVFVWNASVTLCNNAYWIFEPMQVMCCNQRAEIKQLMCDIVVNIAAAQGNVEMDWIVI